MDADTFREAFLKGNANREFIADQFADVIRNLVRAFAATDPSRPLYMAAEKMSFVADLLQRCEDRVTWYSLFADAITSIHQEIPEDPDDRRYIQAAQDGMKYLVETSATDNAAKGRSSRRLNEFRDSIRWSEEARSRR